MRQVTLRRPNQRLRYALHAGTLAVLVGATAWTILAPATPVPPWGEAAAALPTPVAAPAATAGPRVPAPTVPPLPATPSSPPAAARQAAAPTPAPVPTVAAPMAAVPAEQRDAAQQGRLAVAAGDDARAIALLEPLVEAMSGDGRAEVRLALGQALAGAGRFEEALVAAEPVQVAARDPQLVSAARLLKGQALRGLKRWDEAAAEMRAAADANPLVAAAIRLELAEMWLAADRPDDAAADARKGLETAEPRLLTIETAERLGKAEVQRQDPEAAMQAYRQLLTAAGTRGYLGEQLYNLAEGASELGRTDDAVRALRTSITDFPRSRKAPEAVALLEKLGGMRPEDRFAAGLIRYYFWNFRGARADFDAYLAALPDGEKAVEARYYRGLSSLPQDTTAQLLQLAADVPDDDVAPLALYEAGRAQEELGDYTAAEAIYARLIGTYPTRDAGLDGAFRRGLARYARGEYASALAAWDELLRRETPPPLRAQALFWRGKALEAEGDGAGARQAWTAAAAVRPVSYHVVRAQVELENPPRSTGFDPAGARVSTAEEAELAGWFRERGVDLEAAGRAAAAQPGYARMVALARHGLYRQANWEYEAFLTTFADKPAHLYWLAARFGEMGLPNAALRLGSAALDAATSAGQVSVLEVPRALQRAAYPLAFPDLAGPATKQQGVDPLLFQALMRQESDFDPYAESVAKAKGLTQVIPTTGTEIAAKLGVRDFTQESLFQPKRSVEFGAFFFGQRLARNGSVQAALAAYNAGDGNLDTWTTPERSDPDLLAEYIPFAETHDYVQKIYAYWMLNRYIWAGP